MNVLILMWILVWIRMLNHTTSGLRFQDDPGAIALFQIVSDLHARAGRSSSLGAEFDFSVGLIAVDGNAADVHFHGTDVEGANDGQVLQDTSADGVFVVRLLLAPADGEECGEEQYGCDRWFHKEFHFLI